MGILDFLRGVFGGAVREGAEARKQERLNFMAVNDGWAVYAKAMSHRANALDEELVRMRTRLDHTTSMERRCQKLLADAGESIGLAHGKIAALTSRVAELERR